MDTDQTIPQFSDGGSFIIFTRKVRAANIDIRGSQMAWYSKRPVEHIFEDTVVWKCTSCKCWSRKEFVSDTHECPMCGSNMVEEIKNIRID